MRSHVFALHFPGALRENVKTVHGGGLRSLRPGGEPATIVFKPVGYLVSISHNSIVAKSSDHSWVVVGLVMEEALGYTAQCMYRAALGKPAFQPTFPHVCIAIILRPRSTGAPWWAFQDTQQ